jgi:hypothetical protein
MVIYVDAGSHLPKSMARNGNGKKPCCSWSCQSKKEKEPMRRRLMDNAYQVFPFETRWGVIRYNFLNLSPILPISNIRHKQPMAFCNGTGITRELALG